MYHGAGYHGTELHDVRIVISAAEYGHFLHPFLFGCLLSPQAGFRGGAADKLVHGAELCPGALRFCASVGLDIPKSPP